MLRNLALTGLLALAACADPLADMGHLDDVTLAEGLSEEAANRAFAADPARNTGLFGLGLGAGDTAEPAAMTLPQVAPGEVLPWGEVGVVCGLAPAQLGTPAGAGAGFRLYDQGAGTTAPHTFYLTGFADGCARQFTAALVLFGDVGTHEFVRYMTPPEVDPFTEADAAYEALKASFCGVSSGEPCGRRLDALARRATFVTLYATFGGDTSADLLLNDRQLLAAGF